MSPRGEAANPPGGIVSGLVSIGGGHSLSPEAAASWERMKRAGMPGRVINSSTRDYATQKRWFQNKGKPGYPKFVADPDESKHVWRPNDKRDKGARALDLNDPARSWLVKHGRAHGWFRPWPDIEPWHFEHETAQDTHVEDDMPLTRADADLIVDRFLARRIEHTPGQTAASNRESATIERILGDTSAGGFRAWKDLPLLRAELAATRAALVALAKNTALDAKTVERIVSSAVDKALSDISITLTSGD